MVFTKHSLYGLSPDYFLGQALPDLWPGMTNVCHCHKFKNMLNIKLCDICVTNIEVITYIGLYD